MRPVGSDALGAERAPLVVQPLDVRVPVRSGKVLMMASDMIEEGMFTYEAYVADWAVLWEIFITVCGAVFSSRRVRRGILGGILGSR